MVTRPEPAMDTRGEALGARAVAFGIDAAVVGTMWAVIWGGGVAVRSGLDRGLWLVSGDVSAAGAVVWLLTWVVVTGAAFLYFAWPLAIAGQTLGKRMADVVVVEADGGPCGWRAAGARTAVLLAPAPVVALSALLFGLGGAVAGATLVVAWVVLEAVLAVVDDDQRRLGDRLAGTVVVEESLAAV